MYESIIVNLVGLTGDICATIAFGLVLPVRDKRIFWGAQAAGIIISRLLRTFVDGSLGWVMIPFVLGAIVVGSDGPLFRRIIAVSVVFVILSSAEVPVGMLWVALTGTDLISNANAYAHLPIHIMLQTLFNVLTLLVALVMGPLCKRFVMGSGATRTSLIVAVFPLILGILQVCCVRTMFLPGLWKDSYTTVGILVSVLGVASTAFLMRDVQASIDKASADIAAEANMHLADGFLERYAALERSIELSAMLRHDIRNQLGVISELASGSEQGQALTLVGALRHEAEEASTMLDAAVVPGDGDDAPAEMAPLLLQEPHGLALRGSYAFARFFYLAAYAVIAACAVFLANRPYSPLVIRVVSVGCSIAGAVLLPVLFRMLRDAHDADVAAERARAAESLYADRRAYAERLEAEATEASRVREDMVAGLDGLEDLVHAGDRDGLEHLVETTRLRVSPTRRWCEHSAVNMLMELKDQAAQAAGVTLESSIDLPRDVPLPALDLCAVFSNMLDNAIEAASGAPEGKRWVRVAASSHGGYLVIRVENGAARGAAARRSGAGRPGVGEHGWGLRILEEFAHRHDGQLTTGAEGGAFVAQVMLALGSGATA